jgi:hypothetical protein
MASFVFQVGEPDSVMRDLLRQGQIVKVYETGGLRSDGMPICSGWAGRMPDGPLTFMYINDSLRDLPIAPRLLDALELSGEIPVMFLTRQIRAIGRAWGIEFVPWIPPEVRN